MNIRWKGTEKKYYRWWMGGGLIALLIVFVVLYTCGVNTFICLAIVIVSGTFLFIQVYKVRRKYGEHGMMKRLQKEVFRRW